MCSCEHLSPNHGWLGGWNGVSPDDSLRLFRAVVAANGLSLVENGVDAFPRDQLMLFCPAYFGGKTGGKIQAAANLPKPEGAGFTGL